MPVSAKVEALGGYETQSLKPEGGLMSFDPTLIIALPVLVGLAIFFIVRASRRRAGRTNPNPRSGAKIALVVGAGLVVVALIVNLFGRGQLVISSITAVVGVIGLLLVIFSLAGLIADMAEAKGRSWAAFFWLSVLLSPLIMWIVAASVSPLPGSREYVSPGVARDAVDSTEQIKKLSDLQKAGILTKAEFEAKKKDLLDRM
jgi:MFS family permease